MPLQIQFGAQQPAPLNLGSVPQFPGPSGASSQAINNMMALLQKKRAAEAKLKAVDKITKDLGDPEIREWRAVDYSSQFMGLRAEHGDDLVAMKEDLLRLTTFALHGDNPEAPTDELVNAAQTWTDSLMMPQHSPVWDQAKINRTMRMLVVEGGMAPSEAKTYVQTYAGGSAGDADFFMDRVSDATKIGAQFMRPPARPAVTNINNDMTERNLIDELRASMRPQGGPFTTDVNPTKMGIEGDDLLSDKSGISWEGVDKGTRSDGRIFFKDLNSDPAKQARLDEAARKINDTPTIRATYDGWIRNANEDLSAAEYARIGAKTWLDNGQTPPYMLDLIGDMQQQEEPPKPRQPKIIPPREENDPGYGWRFTDPGPPSGQPPGKYPRGPMDPPPSERDQKIDPLDPLGRLRKYEQPR